MHKLFFLICMLFAGTAFSQNTIQFKVSKPYCVYNFMETAIGSGGTSSTLRDFMWQKTDKDAAFQELCERYSRIRLHYDFTRDEYPANRRQTRSTIDLITIALVQASDLKEFGERIMGILPNNSQQELLDVLKRAEVLYNEVIWKEYEQKVLDQANALRVYSERASALFLAFRKFYNSSWSTEMPFIVTLYPIPGRSGSTSATPHANSLCVGVLTDEKDHVGRMGVVLHEICHVLYDEQPAEFQHQLDSYFEANASPFSKYTRYFFDEGLATVLGNGFAGKSMSGILDSTDWYNNPYINGFAKAIYPLVERYLEAGKGIDSVFVNEAIVVFEKTFPRSAADYGILMNNVSIYSDSETQQERDAVRKAISGSFQVTGSMLSSPITDPVSLELMSTGKNTQVIIVEKNHKANMRELTKVFPQIKGMVNKKTDESYMLSFYDAAKRPVIIINVKKPEELKYFIGKMKEMQYLDVQKPYTAMVK